MELDPHVKILRRYPKITQLPEDTIRRGIIPAGAKLIGSIPNLASAPKKASSIYDKVVGALGAASLAVSPDFAGKMVNVIPKAGVAAIGIAAVAGLIYLVYKLWKAHQTGDRRSIIDTARHLANEVLEDFKHSAPDLFAIPGWLDQIKRQIADAVGSGDPATVLGRLASIKEEIVGHQGRMDPAKIGKGLILARAQAANGGQRRTGRGAVSPIYG